MSERAVRSRIEAAEKNIGREFISDKIQAIDTVAKGMMVAGELITWRYNFDRNTAILDVPDDLDPSTYPKEIAGVPTEIVPRPRINVDEENTKPGRIGVRLPFEHYNWKADAMLQIPDDYWDKAWRDAILEVRAERKEREHRRAEQAKEEPKKSLRLGASAVKRFFTGRP